MKIENNGHKGAPDRVLVVPRRAVVFVELKNGDSGRLSGEQQWWQDMLGGGYRVIRDYDEFEEMVDTLTSYATTAVLRQRVIDSYTTFTHAAAAERSDAAADTWAALLELCSLLNYTE